jgi:hypothetical protein
LRQTGEVKPASPTLLRRIAIGGGVFAAILTVAAAAVSHFVAAPVVHATDWPGPARPWRAVEDARLAKHVARIDRRLTLKATWRCETASCGFEGRYLVAAPVDAEQAEAIDSTVLEFMLAALARPVSGDIAWPAFADGQAQAFRLPAGPAFIFAQSDRAPGAAQSMVAGATLDQVIAARFPEARAPAPAIPAPRAAPASAATLGPSPAIPATAPAGAQPSWR